MGCCGDEEDEDVLEHLIADDVVAAAATAEASSSGSDVISPLNSNFSALVTGDILRCIFERLTLPDIARAACVCRTWRSVAADREVQARVFRSPWGLEQVVGNPLSGAFWRHNGLDRFAISHRLASGDSLARLALRYSVQVMDIKRLNNMMSDHEIHSRERLLIPISKAEMLINGTCYIESDFYAKREVAVLYPEGVPDGNFGYVGNLLSERRMKRILESKKRSMQVADRTAGCSSGSYGEGGLRYWSLLRTPDGAGSLGCPGQISSI